MLAMSVTEETSQESRGWLKEAASRNIQPMSVTEETSQELRGWLKEAAPIRNMRDMWSPRRRPRS